MPARSEPLNVVVVDDDAAVLRAMVRTLEREGCHLRPCNTPQEALAVVAAEPVDIVISDLDMPEMNGVELLTRIKRSHPGVVRILITAQGSLVSAVRAINEGEVFRFLTKPWKAEELRQTVAEAAARLTEVRRTESAAALAARRSALLAALERDHPGVTEVNGGGAHSIDPDRLARVLGRLPYRVLPSED